METLAGVAAVWLVIALTGALVSRMARISFAEGVLVVMLGVCAMQLAAFVAWGIWTVSWAVLS